MKKLLLLLFLIFSLFSTTLVLAEETYSCDVSLRTHILGLGDSYDLWPYDITVLEIYDNSSVLLHVWDVDLVFNEGDTILAKNIKIVDISKRDETITITRSEKTCSEYKEEEVCRTELQFTQVAEGETYPEEWSKDNFVIDVVEIQFFQDSFKEIYHQASINLISFEEPDFSRQDIKLLDYFNEIINFKNLYIQVGEITENYVELSCPTDSRSVALYDLNTQSIYTGEISDFNYNLKIQSFNDDGSITIKLNKEEFIVPANENIKPYADKSLKIFYYPGYDELIISYKKCTFIGSCPTNTDDQNPTNDVPEFGLLAGLGILAIAGLFIYNKRK